MITCPQCNGKGIFMKFPWHVCEGVGKVDPQSP